MKRTVTAWAKRHFDHTGKKGNLCPSTIRWEKMWNMKCIANLDIDEKPIRVSITYDDGIKAKPRVNRAVKP